jgi:hypothetical protein
MKCSRGNKILAAARIFCDRSVYTLSWTPQLCFFTISIINRGWCGSLQVKCPDRAKLPDGRTILF